MKHFAGTFRWAQTSYFWRVAMQVCILIDVWHWRRGFKNCPKKWYTWFKVDFWYFIRTMQLLPRSVFLLRKVTRRGRFKIHLSELMELLLSICDRRIRTFFLGFFCSIENVGMWNWGRGRACTVEHYHRGVAQNCTVCPKNLSRSANPEMWHWNNQFPAFFYSGVNASL